MTFNTHIHEWHQKNHINNMCEYTYIYIYDWWCMASLETSVQKPSRWHTKQAVNISHAKKPQPFWIYLYNLRHISYQPVLFIHLRQPFCCLCTLSGSLFYLLSCWVSDCVRQGISLLSLFPYCIFVEVEAAQSVNNTVQNRQKDRNPFKALSSSQTNCEMLTLQVSHKILPIAWK